MGTIGNIKRTVIEQLLTEEDFILVVVLPSVPGVRLPDDLLKAGEPVGLNIGHKMAIPIPDLKLDEAGVTGTLSFNRLPFHCAFPWRAVVQVTADMEHMIWVEPPVEQDEILDEPEPATAPAVTPDEQPHRSHLKLI